MQEALNQKIDAFVAANKEQILKDIATLVSIDRKSTRLNSSHASKSRMPSSA